MVMRWREAPSTFQSRRPAPYTPWSSPMLPEPRYGQMASAPNSRITRPNRSAISSSASLQVTRSKSPAPFGPTRRIGYRRRSGDCVYATKSSSLLQRTPRVKGCEGSPSSFTARPSLTVTIQLHVSGQSIGHAPKTRDSPSMGMRLLSAVRAGRPVPEHLRGGVVHGEEALHADLLQGHVVGCPQGGDGREEAERRLPAPEEDDEDGSPCLARRRALGERGKAGEGEQAREELGGLTRAIRDGVGLYAAKEVQGDLLPVHDEGAQPLGRHQRDGKIHRLHGRCRRPREELDEARRASVGAQEIPPPIHHERRVRLLLRQHVVERATHLRELRRGEIALSPRRREARGEEQRVLLAKGDVQHRGESQDHLRARASPSGLEKAQMSLGGLRGARQVELREPSALAPPAQAGPEAARRFVHGREAGPGLGALSHHTLVRESSRWRHWAPCSRAALRRPSGGCSPRCAWPAPPASRPSNRTRAGS